MIGTYFIPKNRVNQKWRRSEISRSLLRRRWSHRLRCRHITVVSRESALNEK